jgi:peptidyl-prolyl cis-trans isomerase C
MGNRYRLGLMAGLALALAATAWAQQAPQPKASEPAAQPGAAASQKPAAQPAESPDTVVLKVGTESATKADLDYLITNLSPQLQGVVEREGRKPLGDQYTLMMLLSQVAVSDHLDATADFKRHMAFQRLQTLAQQEYDKISEGIKVSPEEISQYYTSHGADFDRAEVREFVIRKKAEGAPDSALGLAPADAHVRADAIRKALAAGTDIKEVTKKFSTPNVVMIDADPRSVRHGQLISTLDKAAFELKDGQLSDPYETAQALAFLQVVGHNRADLKDVSESIENTLRQEKLKAAVDELKSKTTIWMDEEYFKAPAGSDLPPAPPEPKK